MKRELSMRRTIFVLLATSVGLSLGTGCSDDDGGSATPEVPFTVSAISVAGTTSEAATVRIEQQSDADSSDDTAWNATYELDGGTRAASLPVDANADQTFIMTVKSTAVAGGAQERKRVSIRLR